MFSAGGVEVPEFGEPITNLTVPIGRDATFKCIVVNLGNYRVSTLFEECNLTPEPEINRYIIHLSSYMSFWTN